jgi:hypothetical protein
LAILGFKLFFPRAQPFKSTALSLESFLGGTLFPKWRTCQRQITLKYGNAMRHAGKRGNACGVHDRRSAGVMAFSLVLAGLVLPAASAQKLKTVEVEGLPLAANVKRMIEAFEYLGAPLPVDIGMAPLGQKAGSIHGLCPLGQRSPNSCAWCQCQHRGQQPCLGRALFPTETQLRYGARRCFSTATSGCL